MLKTYEKDKFDRSFSVHFCNFFCLKDGQSVRLKLNQLKKVPKQFQNILLRHLFLITFCFCDFVWNIQRPGSSCTWSHWFIIKSQHTQVVYSCHILSVYWWSSVVNTFLVFFYIKDSASYFTHIWIYIFTSLKHLYKLSVILYITKQNLSWGHLLTLTSIWPCVLIKTCYLLL